MFKIGSKGEEKTVGLLYEIIAIIAVLIILVAVFTSMSKRANDSTQDTLCRASVILRGKASIALVEGLVEFEKITPLACHTREMGKLKGDREEVKQEIAKYSAKCWWLFAEGSVADLFKVDKKEKACFVCYTFTVDDNIDKGTESRVRIFVDEPTVAMRDDNITNYEMTNYLASEAYNPGIIYGGGTKSYFGVNYDYGLDVKFTGEPREIKPSKIKSTLVTGYVLDYSFLITDETKTKINDVGVELQQRNAGNLLVIVADEFSSLENSDARTIIENTRLNSNSTNYDAILVMLDLKEKTMRIHVGADQSVFIKDYELNDIMVEAFKNGKDNCKDTTCNIDEINKALVESVTQVSDKILNKANTLQGISPKSYYYYITNGGYTWTMMSDISPQRTYAITYVAVSDETGWKVLTPVLTIAGAVGGVIGGVVLTISGVGAPGGIPLLIASVGVLGGGAGAVGYGAGRLIDAPEQNIRPNNIMIVPVDSLGDQCTILK